MLFSVVLVFVLLATVITSAVAVERWLESADEPPPETDDRVVSGEEPERRADASQDSPVEEAA